MRSEQVREKVATDIGKPFWKGPDVKLHIPEGQLIVPPCTDGQWYRVYYQLTKEHLFPTEGLDSSALKIVKEAVKSRDAQSGTDLRENTPELIWNSLRHKVPNLAEKNNLTFIDFLRRSDTIEEAYTAASHAISHFDLTDTLAQYQFPYTLVANRGERPLILKDGKPLFRFYAPLKPSLAGKELISAIKDREIKFEGKEGVDWNIANNGDKTDPIAIGVMTKVKASSELWIPPSNQPFYMDPEVKDYRGILKNLLRPLPAVEESYKLGLEPEDNILKIGETPHLTLSKRIEAELYKAVSPTITGVDWYANNAGIHINSYLIDAGSSWPIRVEILSPFKDRKDRFVLFRFFSNE